MSASWARCCKLWRYGAGTSILKHKFPRRGRNSVPGHVRRSGRRSSRQARLHQSPMQKYIFGSLTRKFPIGRDISLCNCSGRRMRFSVHAPPDTCKLRRDGIWHVSSIMRLTLMDCFSKSARLRCQPPTIFLNLQTATRIQNVDLPIPCSWVGGVGNTIALSPEHR